MDSIDYSWDNPGDHDDEVAIQQLTNHPMFCRPEIEELHVLESYDPFPIAFMFPNLRSISVKQKVHLTSDFPIIDARWLPAKLEEIHVHDGKVGKVINMTFRKDFKLFEYNGWDGSLEESRKITGSFNDSVKLKLGSPEIMPGRPIKIKKIECVNGRSMEAEQITTVKKLKACIGEA